MNEPPAGHVPTGKPAEPGGTGRTADGRPLAALEVRLHDVLTRIAEGFVALDSHWRFQYLNPAAERMWGVEAANLVGRTVFDALSIGQDNFFQTQFDDAKASGEPAHFSARSGIVDAWLEVRGYPHPRGFTVFFRDVTSERLASRSAKARQRRLDSESDINRRIFETSQDLIFVTDRNGNFVRVSPSAKAIIGYDPEEMIGRSAVDFIHHEDLENTRAEMRRARHDGGVCNFDCRYMHKDGLVLPLSWKGIWSAPEQHHFFIGRDMSERVAAEERLRHAQRLEAVGQLTGGIAHDFNNLLSVVMGNTELVIENEGLSGETKELCRATLHAAQRGAELTRQLLAFARQQPLEPKVVDVNALVGNITQLMARTIGQSIEVRFEAGEGLWPALIDPANLEAAIANLAVNARDAMPNGGRLIVETTNTTLDEEYVRENPDAAPGEYVSVAVSDTGTGIPPALLHRIFEPFFTTKEAGKGTGLGLSMVFGFVKQSDGHIKAYSEPGVGTSFRLYLPRATGAHAEESATAVNVAAPDPGRDECILVVEDNPAIRDVVLRQLARLGYRTLEAEDGARALALLATGEDIDLLFTDVVMPGGMNGHQLAQAAAKLRPGLKVLYTSGFPGAAITGGSGGAAVISKPYRTADLARKLREVLNG